MTPGNASQVKFSAAVVDFGNLKDSE